MSRHVWRIGPAGQLTTEVGEFRLFVSRTTMRDGTAEFCILRQARGRIEAAMLMGIGREANVHAAMVAAEHMVGRLTQQT